MLCIHPSLFLNQQQSCCAPPHPTTHPLTHTLTTSKRAKQLIDACVVIFAIESNLRLELHDSSRTWMVKEKNTHTTRQELLLLLTSVGWRHLGCKAAPRLPPPVFPPREFCFADRPAIDVVQPCRGEKGGLDYRKDAKTTLRTNRDDISQRSLALQ